MHSYKLSHGTSNTHNNHDNFEHPVIIDGKAIMKRAGNSKAFKKRYIKVF